MRGSVSSDRDPEDAYEDHSSSIPLAPAAGGWPACCCDRLRGRSRCSFRMENETELITRITVTLTPVGVVNGPDRHHQMNPPDGMGPLSPLRPQFGPDADPGNHLTTETVGVFDASDPNDVEDITVEVREEDDEHRFFYTVTGVTGGDGTRLIPGHDGNGAPLGVTFQVVAAEERLGLGDHTGVVEPLR